MNHFAFVDLRDRYGITQAHEEKQPTVVFQQMGVGKKGALKGEGWGGSKVQLHFFSSPIIFCDFTPGNLRLMFQHT